MNLTLNELYINKATLMVEYLSLFTYPWEALKGIKEEIIRIGNTLDKNEYNEI